MYLVGLGDLKQETLTNAFIRCLHECRFFPSIAEIRKLATEPDDELSAEKAWQTFLRIFGCWHPDIGFVIEPPKLDAAGEHAMRTIGGIRRFALTEIANENFIRKEFIEAYKYHRKTQGLLAPTQAEAAAFLNQSPGTKLPEWPK